LGARAETLAGLSGFGDLVLTCTSDAVAQFPLRLRFGQGRGFRPQGHRGRRGHRPRRGALAAGLGIDMPVTAMVNALALGKIALNDAIGQLMSRPLKQE
jgi:glycerol-3-phosphate dehydrogenase (NAD(P)+)